MSLFRSFSSNSRASTSSGSRSNSTTKNANLVDFPDQIQALNKWTIPKVAPREIYKLGFTDRFSSSQLAVKTVEETVTMDSSMKTIELLTIEDLAPYLGQSKYVHIGLIQIAFKPLTLPGLNASLLATLNDARCTDWKESLMGVIQTSLCHGPVYFNVHPNLNLSLTDKNFSKALCLRVQTHGYNFLPGSETIAIVYRVYFKTLQTLCPNARHIDLKDHTVFIETNLLVSNIATNRVLSWNEIQFPEQWTLPQATEPVIPTTSIVEQIIQHQTGDVEISFSPTNRIRFLPARSSVDSPSVIYPSDKSQISRPPYKVSMPPSESNLEGIRISTSQIPQGVYRQEPDLTSVPRRSESPTPSDMSFHLP